MTAFALALAFANTTPAAAADPEVICGPIASNWANAVRSGRADNIAAARARVNAVGNLCTELRTRVAGWQMPRIATPPIIGRTIVPPEKKSLSGLTTGSYTCQLSEEYRFRRCTIKRLANNDLFLEFNEGLFGLSGKISYRSGRLFFSGHATGDPPYYCNICRNTHQTQIGDVFPNDSSVPMVGNVWCDSTLYAAIKICASQTFESQINKVGAATWSANLEFKSFSNEYNFNKDASGKTISRTVKGYSTGSGSVKLTIQKAR